MLSLDRLNQNIQVSAGQYGQPVSRTLKDVRAHFGADRMDHHIERLSPGDWVLLPGGGLGIYGLELIRMGYRVLQVVPQDYYRVLIALSGQLDHESDLFGDGTLTHFSNGIPVLVLANLFFGLGLSLPDGVIQRRVDVSPSVIQWEPDKGFRSDEVAKNIAKQIRRALRIRGQYIRDGKLVVRSQSFEEFFRGGRGANRGTISLIIDYGDAFRYSANRFFLAGAYSSLLKPDGYGFVDITAIEDEIYLVTGGLPMSLGDFLNEYYLVYFFNYFQLDARGDFENLLIRPGVKDPGSIGDYLRATWPYEWMDYGNGLQVPRITYRFKRRVDLRIGVSRGLRRLGAGLRGIGR